MVIRNVIIPALLYFPGIGAMIVVISGKLNIAPMPEEEYTIIAETSDRDWVFSSVQIVVSVGVLLCFLFIDYSAGASAAYALIILIYLGLLCRPEGVTVKDRLNTIWVGLEKAGFSVLPVSMASAAAGISQLASLEDGYGWLEGGERVIYYSDSGRYKPNCPSNMGR